LEIVTNKTSFKLLPQTKNNRNNKSKIRRKTNQPTKNISKQYKQLSSPKHFSMTLLEAEQKVFLTNKLLRCSHNSCCNFQKMRNNYYYLKFVVFSPADIIELPPNLHVSQYKLLRSEICIDF
jgi:hypothetical protein